MAKKARTIVAALESMNQQTRRRHFMTWSAHTRLRYWDARTHAEDHRLNPQEHEHAAPEQT
jgi:hypothetical protein